MKDALHSIIHAFHRVRELEIEEARIRTKKRVLVKKIWKRIDTMVKNDTDSKVHG